MSRPQPDGSDLREVTDADVPVLAPRLAAAFQEDPAMSWAFSDPTKLPFYPAHVARSTALTHSGPMRTRVVALALSTALLALTASSAEAASPPAGKYPCLLYIDGTGLVGAGLLRIHSGGKYSVNGGKKGKFTTSGRKIKFKTGDYRKSHRGKWSGKGRERKGRPVQEERRGLLARAHHLRLVAPASASISRPARRGLYPTRAGRLTCARSIRSTRAITTAPQPTRSPCGRGC